LTPFDKLRGRYPAIQPSGKHVLRDAAQKDGRLLSTNGFGFCFNGQFPFGLRRPHLSSGRLEGRPRCDRITGQSDGNPRRGIDSPFGGCAENLAYQRLCPPIHWTAPWPSIPPLRRRGLLRLNGEKPFR